MVLQILVEGILERGTLDDGERCKMDELLAGETFGQESLIKDKHVNEVYVSCLQPTVLLQVHKANYERYVRPLQLSEWGRISTIVSELPVFNEPDAVWEGHRLGRLLQSLQLKAYVAGDVITQEGTYNKNLLFIVSGHCHVTKHVVDEKLKKKAALLPSPLRSTVALALMEGGSKSQADGREVDITVLYRGAVIDAEAALEMKHATYTATAMSHVEVAYIDTSMGIFVDDPVSLERFFTRIPFSENCHTNCEILIAGDRC